MFPSSREVDLALLRSLEVELPTHTTLTSQLVHRRLLQALDHAQHTGDVLPDYEKAGSSRLRTGEMKPWRDPAALHGSFIRGMVEEAVDDNARRSILGGKTKAETLVDPFTRVRQSLSSLTRHYGDGLDRFCFTDPIKTSDLYRYGSYQDFVNSVQWEQFRDQPPSGAPTSRRNAVQFTSSRMEQRLMANVLDLNATRLLSAHAVDRDPSEKEFTPSFFLPAGPIKSVSLGWLSRNEGCAVCGQEGSKTCAACHAVMYCSAECQRSHWQSGHKLACKTLKDAAWTSIAFTTQPYGMPFTTVINRRDDVSKGFGNGLANGGTTDAPSNAHGDEAFQVKIQYSGGEMMMVYDRRRSFTGHYVRPSDAVGAATYDALARIIVGNGRWGGMKVFCWAKRVGDWELALALDRLPDQNVLW